MSKKFTKDIEIIKNSRVLSLDDTDYTDPFNKDDRVFINLYFIDRQLNTIKWVLIITAIILIYYIFIK